MQAGVLNAELAQLPEITDEGLAAMVAAHPEMGETLEELGPYGLRRVFKWDHVRMRSSKPPGMVDDLMYVPCEHERAAEAWLRWRDARTLPLLPAVTALHSSDADSAAMRVNPTAWPAVPPYVSLSGGGGFEKPWEVLQGISELDAFATAPDAATIPELALRIFGRAAAAIQRLDAAGALRVLIDVGDVITFPHRCLPLLREPGLPDVEFDRIHLNNVPDYVRFHVNQTSEYTLCPYCRA